jgi:regulatory protein YycI of two-component signal transduction system YycFG
MDEQKKKIILISLVVFLAIGLVLVIVFVSKRSKLATDSPSEESKEAQIAREEFETTYQKVTGTVTSVKIEALDVLLENGTKLSLNIPHENVSFLKPVKRENGDVVLKNIGLFDIPENQLVDIEYNIRTNEVMLVVVK